jgi:hypothetical protein
MKNLLLFSRYRLGTFAVQDLIAFGVSALEAGLDSVSLRQLSWASQDESENISKLFEQSLMELGLKLPSTDEACIALAAELATEAIDGRRSPYDVAREVWWKIYNRFPQVERLRVFVGLASEYEDDWKNRASYEAEMVEEFKSLLAEQNEID